MSDKKTMIARLRDIFDRWEALLAGFDEARITAQPAPSEMSIKDTISHLWAWQQISIARVIAALHDAEPVFPEWPTEDPDSEEDLHHINAWIFDKYQDKSWSQVHEDWKNGFLRFLELSETVPDSDMFDEKKYPWLRGYDLYAVLHGSYEHHREHIEQLKDRHQQLGP